MSPVRSSSRPQADGTEQLKILITVTTEAEADLIRGRLLDAGIHAVSQRTIGGPEWGPSGARRVFVSEQELSRAEKVLEQDEHLSDEELARLSDEAGRDA
jgi:hypothetical protein